MYRILFILMLAMGVSAVNASQRLSVQTVEKATFSGKIPASDQTSPFLVKAEVLLDRAHFSPGQIAAFGTHNPWTAFQVGMAASLGAGISMGFAEALADDGNPASDRFVIKTIIGYAFPVPGVSSGASERATASSPTNPMSRSTARLGQP